MLQGLLRVIAKRRVQRQVLTGQRYDFSNFLKAKAGLGDNIFRQRRPTEFLRKTLEVAQQLASGFHNVSGDPNHMTRINHATSDELPYPPSRIGGKTISEAVVELLGGAHQTDVSLLNQV